MIIRNIKQAIKALSGLENDYPFLQQNVIVANNIKEVKKAFGWNNDPILDRPDIYDFDYIEDINERRIRDAESLGLVMRNAAPKTALEIGTANGMGTILMAVNAPNSKVYTVNIPPEEIEEGKGGHLITVALERDQIGIEYKKRGITNVELIYANTATWNPNIGFIDVAFIDGCHDTEFVFNDTRKVLEHMHPGSFILWHDFNPELAKKYAWIGDVCRGVELLYQKGFIKGRIIHLRDSWVGIYKV